VSDTGSELYVIEQFHDYRMVDDYSVVEQAHEIQTLAKELKNFGTVLPDKFVAGCIIAKLPQARTDFATSLKYKRQEFGIADFIDSLDVEEKAKAKDVCGKILLREVLVPMWCRKTLKIPTRRNSSKSSNKRQLHLLRRRRRIRKREIASLVASPGIMLGTARRASGSLKRNLQT
jgi:hypothetical protein